jgi:hypothetical protein
VISILVGIGGKDLNVPMANDGARMSTLTTTSSASEEPWTIARLRELGVKLRSVYVRLCVAPAALGGY